MNRKPAIVVLAAGRGSRFLSQQHKLVQPLGTATVMGQTILHAIESRLPVVVVTTNALATEALRWVARRDLVLLPEVGSAPGEPLGMGYSIAAGVMARPHAPGWLLLPADMPAVLASSLQAVATALEQQPVAFAQHHGRRGHPVAFAAELFSELSLLTGDDGARRVIARYPSIGVELDDPGVLQDVDTLAGLEAMQRSMGRAETSAEAIHSDKRLSARSP